MGALVGLGVGVGLLLVWASFALPRQPRASQPDPRGWASARCSGAPVSRT